MASSYLLHFQILAACVMGLSTFSGGSLEGYISPALPTLLLDPHCSQNASALGLNDTNEVHYCDPQESIALNSTPIDMPGASFQINEEVSLYRCCEAHA